MAVSLTNLDTYATTTDASSYTTSTTISPAANRLLLLGGVSGSDVDISSISAFGLTWTKVTSFAPGGAAYRLHLWRAVTGGSAPTPGTVTVNMAASTSGIALIIDEVDGVDTANPVPQYATDVAPSGDLSLSATLAALNSGSGSYGIYAHNAGTTFSAGSGYTLHVASFGFATPTRRTAAEWRSDGQTTVDGTLSSNSTNAGLIAIEIKAAAAAAAVPTRTLMGVGT